MHTFLPSNHQKLKKYLGCKDKPGEFENILWVKVKKYIPYFSLISGVECICVCNSLAMNACHKGSDIDLFVITRKNRLWTARIGLTLITSLLGVRKTSRRHAGGFCLSFFISEDEENFSNIAIKNDIYLSYWIETLVPIINKNNTFERFLMRNKIEDFHKKSIKSDINTSKSNGGEKYRIGILGDLNEYLLKKIFLRKTLKNYEKLGKPFGVVISDTMLKFHDKDKRKEIRDTF